MQVRVLFLLPDSNEPAFGEFGAASVGSLVKMMVCIAQISQSAAGSLSSGGGAFDWIKSHPGYVGWGLALLALAYLAWSNRAAIRRFCSEVMTELRKCSWPWDPTQTGLRRYKELIDSSVVVLVSMVLLGAYTSVVDFFLVKATAWVIHWRF